MGQPAEVEPKAFARAFRDARKKKGWTQMDAAINLGVHLRTIQFWESGEFEPDLSYYRRCCLEFGWPVPKWLRVEGSTRVLVGGKAHSGKRGKDEDPIGAGKQGRLRLDLQPVPDDTSPSP